jgi:hypothetical protein
MDSYKQQSAITSWLEGRPKLQTTYTTLVVSLAYITGTYFVKYPVFLLPNTDDVGPLQLKVRTSGQTAQELAIDGTCPPGTAGSDDAMSLDVAGTYAQL